MRVAPLSIRVPRHPLVKNITDSIAVAAFLFSKAFIGGYTVKTLPQLIDSID